MERSDSNGLKAVFLSALLASAGLKECTRNKAPQPARAPETSTPSAVDPEREDHFKRIWDLLTRAPLTPEEEAAPCIELGKELATLDANADPVAFMNGYEGWRTCMDDLSSPAHWMANDQLETAILAHTATYFRRCTPMGEDFSIEMLEACEDVDEQLAILILDEGESRGWNFDWENSDRFEWTVEGADGETYLNDFFYPGIRFTFESSDGEYGMIIQANLHEFESVGTHYMLSYALTESSIPIDYVPESGFSSKQGLLSALEHDNEDAARFGND